MHSVKDAYGTESDPEASFLFLKIVIVRVYIHRGYVHLLSVFYDIPSLDSRPRVNHPNDESHL